MNRIRLWKQLYKQTKICTFVRLSQVNKSRVSVLELRQVLFRREIKRRIQGRVSFPHGRYLLKHFLYSNLLFIHIVSCFDRFQCWLNSQRSPWHCRRSFLERKQAHKIKIKCQRHAPNAILKLSGKKYPKHREKTLKTKLASSCFQDAGKSLSPTSSTFARS